MASFPLSVKKNACDMAGERFRAWLILTPQGHSAPHWVGEKVILSLRILSAAMCLSHVSCRSCLPTALCSRRLAAGGMVRSHWS